ncbi:MAG: hypothetical protein H0V04_06045 [Chloroflexi bacterium]|nr:hypothetical protein [Chloroflexota bacterium]
MTGSNLRRTAGLAALSALFAVAALPSVAAAHPPQRILATDGAPAAHALIVDRSGTVHVAIERTDARGIWYATNAGGAWHAERVTRRDDVEPAITIVRGTVIIAFARLGDDGESNGIFTATAAGLGWEIARVTREVDRTPSVDAHDGTVHLVFRNARYQGSLTYMTLGGSPSSIAQYCCSGLPSLRVNEQGRPFVAFSLTYGGLVLGRRTNDGEWINEVVDRHKTRAPQLVLAYRPTLGYLRKREGPMVRAWFGSQVNDVGSWGIRGLPGGDRRFDLVVEGDEINAFTIGERGSERAGRILWTFMANDYRGTILVRGPRDVRSLEVERVGRGDGSIGTSVVIVYGRDDGVWTTTN